VPDITHDTFRAPDGTFRYRIIVDGIARLTSGGFLLQRDAESCGAHIAQDPEVLAYIKD
jgi:hypothetical protein